MTGRKTRTMPDIWRMDSGDAPPPSGAFIAVVPGEAAPLFPLDLPARLRDGIRNQVARQQVENLLQDSLDAVELRVNRPGRDGAAAALVVTAERARDWRDRLSEQGRRVAALLPDYLVLPVVAEGWALRCLPEGDRVLARLGPADGFAAGLPVALAQLRAVLARSGAPQHVYLCDSPVPETLRSVLEATSAEIHAGWPDEAALLGHGEADFNLFRDPAADRMAVRRQVRRWRGPMAAMAAGLAALAAALWIDGARIEAAAQRQRDAATEVARAAFLPSGPILNLRLQVGRVVAERQAAEATPAQGVGSMDVLHAAAQVLAQSPVTLRRVTRTAGTPLRVELEVGDFAALEQVVARLNGGATRARVVNSSAEADARVAALVEILAAPGAAERGLR